MIFFNESALRNSATEFLAHCDSERNHQGVGHKIPLPGAEVGQTVGTIECRERLGGLLKYYHRKAA
jgi:putative transposase